MLSTNKDVFILRTHFIGRAAAEESLEDLKDLIKDTQILFLTAGKN